MRIRQYPYRRNTWLPVLLAAFALSVLVGLPALFTGVRAFQATDKSSGRFLNLDIRVTARSELAAALNARPAAVARALSMAKSMRSADALQIGQTPSTHIKFSDQTGSAEIVESQTGALTIAAPGRNGYDIVRDYLRANAAVYGINASEVDQLHFIGEMRQPKRAADGSLRTGSKWRAGLPE